MPILLLALCREFPDRRGSIARLAPKENESHISTQRIRGSRPMLLITASLKKSDSRDNDVVRPVLVRPERLSDANQMRGDVSSPRQHVAQGFQRLLDLAWEQTLLNYTSRTSGRRRGE